MTRTIVIVIASIAVHAAIAAGMSFVDPPPRRAPDRPVDVEVFRPPPPPPATNRLPAPPPPTPPPAEPKPAPAEKPQSVSRTTTRTARPAAEPATSTPNPDPSTPTAPTAGSGPTIKMDDLGPGTVAVATGPRTTGSHGGGGHGSGTGSAVGSGSAEPAPAAPMSIASIKTKAKPRGDYGYLDAGKDYPAEARRFGVEGEIKVRLLVDATGKVTKRTLLTKLGHGLDELALARAKKIEFEPALDTDDHPVASVVVWTFTFTLPD